MKKSYSLPDDNGAAPSYDFGDAVPLPAPAAANDGLIFDDGEPFALADTTTSGSTSAGSAKPVATIATLADYLINGFWQYNSSIAHHWASSTVTYNITGLNAAEQFLAQTALQAWHEVANVTFVQTTGTANITFSDAGTMQAVTNASWYSNGAMASANVDISQDWITNDGGARDGKTGIDSYGYQTYIHEIGHALGLGHQGPYNGSASYSTDALYANDTWQYSIMSYFAQNSYSGSTYRYVVSPEMADIYAVGQIYGAATATRTGATVYGFHSNAGSVYDFSAYTRAPALTIYDSGGNDTLDCSGYSVAQTIDLHAGAFSSVGGLVNNIGIALSTKIETAIAGSGNDTLIANDNGCALFGGAGDDTLIGGTGIDRLVAGTGADTMTGGLGADTFVFAAGDSSAASGRHDRITDFVSGADHIDLSGMDAITSTSAIDQFRFVGTSSFDGSAGELNYFYNSAQGVTTLQGDTNGDGIADIAIDLAGNVSIAVGDLQGATAATILIEAFGQTKLDLNGSNLSFDPISGGTGPLFKVNGGIWVTGQFGGWTPVGVEQANSGYVLAWKLTGSDQFTASSVDANGNYIANIIGSVSANNSALKSLESTFHQDLNGDGVIGVVTTVVESFGVTKLDQTGSNFSFDPVSGGSGPTFTVGGAAWANGQFGGWTPIGAEKVAAGYDIAWKLSGADQYTVSNTDDNGNYISNIVGAVPGSSDALKACESTFHQDLNGDGMVGLPVTTIESFGSTKLDQVGVSYFFDPVTGGTGPQFSLGGVAVAPGQFGGWNVIGVEQVASGFTVAFKLAGADQFTVSMTDINGNYLSNVLYAAAGSSVELKAQEDVFHQDFNADGVIGNSPIAIEAYGITKLDQLGSNYYFDPSGGGPGVEFKVGGAAFVTGQFGGWVAIGVEQTASGFDLAFKLAGSDLYAVSNIDSGGNYITNILTNVSGADGALKSIEATFHQDLNGDGTIGDVAHSAEIQHNFLTSVHLL